MNDSQKANGERFLVIGRNSYVGRLLVPLLESHGCPVTTVGSEECDLLDADKTQRFVQGLPDAPYAVIFLAVINKSRANDFAAFSANLRLLEHFVAAMKTRRTVHWTFFSSVDVYGRPASPLSETTPVEPDGWYGMAKFAGEFFLRQSLGEIPLTVVRLPGVYGGFDPAKTIVDRFIQSARDGQITVFGDGTARRDFIHAADLARVLVKLAERRFAGRLNVATGQSLALREIVGAICNEFNPACKVNFTAGSADRNFDLSFDLQRLKQAVPDFQPMTFAEGLRQVKVHLQNIQPGATPAGAR